MLYSNIKYWKMPFAHIVTKAKLVALAAAMHKYVSDRHLLPGEVRQDIQPEKCPRNNVSNWLQLLWTKLLHYQLGEQ